MPRSRTASRLVALMTLLVVTTAWTAGAASAASSDTDYGMILADNGSPWYISGMSDPRFDDDVLHELDVITGRDLEVVDTTGLVNTP